MDRTQTNNTPSTLKESIDNFLQNEDEHIKYSPDKEIVLLLGNTGSGKSTLAQYISGNADKLVSIEVVKGAGEYVVNDPKNKISITSTIVSHTLYPDLVKDTKSNTLYYDCPGFSDTRSAAHEIAATYFTKKIIDSARSVKIVFVVSYHSVTIGADRMDFILTLRHATEFLKQIESFKNSIALVVTKVENRYVDNKIVADEVIIKAIGHFLEQAIIDINEHPEIVTLPGQSSNTKERILYLLGIFLSGYESGHLRRIGIFRKPNEPGLLSDIELLKGGKISLQNLINKNIKFIEADKKDFGYTVSAKSIVHISHVVEEINKTILKEISDLGKKAEEYYDSLENETSDLQYLNLEFQAPLESFSKIQEDAIKDKITPEQFISEIENNVKCLDNDISDKYIKKIQKQLEFINFLDLVSNQSIRNNKASQLAAGLSELTEYFNKSHSFYCVLNNIHRRLSQFDFQKNRNEYKIINIKEFNDFSKYPFFKEIEVILKEHIGIGKMKLNKRRLNLLNRVLDETLIREIDVSKPDIDKIVVKGVNVILSDLEELLSVKDIEFLEVYALHKLFIDTSFDLTGREIQMTIVAPVWEVIGSQSIILDGKPGSDYGLQKAMNGMWNETVRCSENGRAGKPGKPGGPAGNFIGIGKHYINEGYLRISANGGKGGRGQDGGDGAEGTSEWYWRNVIRDGGNGGDGGIGGYGGHRGTIYTVEVGSKSGVARVNQTAVDGHPGLDGIGGKAGEGGRHCELQWSLFLYIIPYFKTVKLDKRDKKGQPGETGGNKIMRESPRQLTRRIIDLSQAKSEYKCYLLNNLNNNLQETSLNVFLGEIDTCQESVTQIVNIKKRYKDLKDFGKAALRLVNPLPKLL